MSARDIVGTLATRVALIAAGLLSSVITARYLGPDGRGAFFYWTAVMAVIVQFGNLGLHASNAYLLTKRGVSAGVLTANSIVVALVVGTGLSVVALVVMHGLGVMGDARLVTSVALVSLSVGSLCALLGTNLLIALGQVGEFNRVELVTRYGAVLVLFAAAWQWRDVDAMLLAFGLAMLAAAAYTISRVLRHAALEPPSLSVLRLGFGYGLRAYLLACLGLLVSRINAFILEPQIDATQYGIWSIAMQFFDVINVIPASLAIVLFPRILRSDQPDRLLWPQVGLVVVLLLIVALTFALIGPYVIHVLYGEAFAPAYWQLLWALPGVFGVGVTSILSQYLAAQGFPWRLVWIWVVVAIVQAALAYLLIPSHGASGAMLALSVSYLLLMVLVVCLTLSVRRRHAKASAP